MSKNLWITGFGALSVAALAAVATMAAPPPQDRSDSTQPLGQQRLDGAARTDGARADNRLDSYLIECLTKANQNEVAAARVAQQRSSNQDVKKFAMQMSEDHTKFLNRLSQVTGSVKSDTGLSRRPHFRGAQATPRANPTGSDANQTNSDQQVKPDNQVQSQPSVRAPRFGRRHMAAKPVAEGGHGAAHEFVRIMEDVAQQCQQSKMRELSKKEGQEFDRCYLTSQVFAHQWMADALTVFEQHASSELRPILQEGLQTTQTHLTHAKSLLMQIDQGHAGQAASRTNQTSFRK